MISNFRFLNEYWSELANAGEMAEFYLYSDPSASMSKLNLLANGIVMQILHYEQMQVPENVTYTDCVGMLKDAYIINEDINAMLLLLRSDALADGNVTVDYVKDMIKVAFDLSNWFMTVYGDCTYIPKEYADITADSQLSDCPNTFDSEMRADDSVTETEPKSDISIEVTASDHINYALYQHSDPIIQKITVHNGSDDDIQNARLCISSGSDIIAAFSADISFLPANKSYAITNIPVTVNAEALINNTERIKTNLKIALYKDSELIALKYREITALTFDQWHGCTYMPELLASFVTPNHPVLAPIIERASEYLLKWTGEAELDAYQTQDPNRVLKQAAAIYESIRELDIKYCAPVAAFEKAGQRIKLCDTVITERLAGCLDLSLLYASCLERIGLHPIVILTNKHALCGVWLAEESFPDAVNDDPSLITIGYSDGINTLEVVETTLCTSGKNADFDQAKKAARDSFIGADNSYCIIDIYRSRCRNIIPLPMRVYTDSGVTLIKDTDTLKINADSPENLDTVTDTTLKTRKEIPPKISYWERKLLDLGLRNNLISMHFTKSLMPILTTSPSDLENALSGGSDFRILPKPLGWVMQEAKLGFESTLDLKSCEEDIKSDFKSKILRSAFSENKLTENIKHLYRASKVSLEENGTNSLFLALGALKWYKTPKSTEPLYAPLVLIPVEIIRKSANAGFILRLRDDEPQMNITILEKIKLDFKITVPDIDPLPADEQGVNLRLVFKRVRDAVKEQKRWDVLESAYLGIFSFSQFVMCNDLRNRTDDLMENKVVRSLVEGRLCWDAQPMDTEEKVEENQVLLPVLADASQLYAINAACQQQSFVLHGPPGSGKSQTITALIANALAQGKTVLFVAEKMAALEVVQKRLESIGIGAFCLELHSNKSKKRYVLNQLKNAIEVTKKHTPEEYAEKAEQAYRLRCELDAYASQLHKKLACGYTIFELINDYEQYKEAPDVTAVSVEDVREITKSQLSAQHNVLERLTAVGKAIAHPHSHPLSPIGVTRYSQTLKNELSVKVGAYKKELESSGEAISSFALMLERPTPTEYQDIELLFEVAEEMRLWSALPKEWARCENLSFLLTEINEMADHFISADTLKESITENWDELFLQQDGKQLLNRYKEISQMGFLQKLSSGGGFYRQLKIFTKGKLSKEQMAEGIKLLCNYQEELYQADTLANTYKSELGDLWQGGKTDWHKIKKLADSAKASADRLYSLSGSDSIRISCCGNNNLLEPADTILKIKESFVNTKNACFELLEIKDAAADTDWVKEQIDMCDKIIRNTDSLKEWIAFNSVAFEAKQLGLSGIVDEYKNGLAHEDIIPAYKKAVLYNLIIIGIDDNYYLSSFSGADFDEKIEQYKKLDKRFTELTKQEIYCTLASRVPSFVKQAAESSELNILQREITSGGRGKSLRKLFEEIPNLLPRICPCMLMSPISVAQYLNTKHSFDIIVFDEASQLPTCKAVGVLSRGKNAVIVGDPKQMPPTSFFAANTSDEENYDSEDLESILDDCLALNMPQTHLLWHYRSRHESLIAFCNNYFYENRLLTFPSVNDRHSRVSLIYTENAAEKTGARKNLSEAKAVVAEIVRRSKDPELSKQSVGVVTFNINQQHLIDDLLTEECKKDAELDSWVYRSEEPVFIKNLENVQGDERDVIIFSVGYRPLKDGKVSLNFGPLNRDGGWRRLNVAVSRSRYEMIVFSSLHPDMINLSKTSSKGVAALKAFLDYASGKELEVNENTADSFRDINKGIASSISERLKKHGYAADLSVGQSEYRIDIGVIDPKNADNYILGILLDGKCYNDAKTTHDREIGQISVLKGLGWNIMRVWTIDWWDNPEKELGKIILRLQELEAGKETDCKDESGDGQEPENNFVEDTEDSNDTSDEVSPVTKYTAAIIQNAQVSADFFVSGYCLQDIISSIIAVIEQEAPITQSLMTKRIIQSFGISRAGNRIQEYLECIYSELNYKTTRFGDEKVFWKADQSPDSFSAIRASSEIESSRRDAKDVPIEEAVNAVCYIVKEQVSLSEQDLIREAAKLMGYTRAGNVVSSLFSAAVTKALQDLKIKYAPNQKLISNDPLI